MKKKTWSFVLLNKKYLYSYLKCIVYDKLLKPRQSFRIAPYILEVLCCCILYTGRLWTFIRLF